MELTDSQKAVLYNLVKGVRDGKESQTLGGFAGTGKSVLITFLKRFFPDFAVCAYTGKAANVLRKKGVSGARTIHSQIYVPKFFGKTVVFELTTGLDCDGFIVDEASMIPEEVYEDLRSFGLPLIFVGDHGQLEPIGSSFNLMQNPDYRLEEIHRNAGDIARFADHLRRGFTARGFAPADGSVEFIHGNEPSIDLMLDVDQVICAYNRTRAEINRRIRQAHGFVGVLQPGEKIMCLRNSRKDALFNGMQGQVLDIYGGDSGRLHLDFEFAGQKFEKLRYTTRHFGEESYEIDFDKDSPHPFDYAYAVTGHKSQGDQWPRVLVVEQRCQKWNHRRWAYTCASRAESKLYWQYA